MTPEDQRIAVAEAHGFKWYRAKDGKNGLGPIFMAQPFLAGPIGKTGRYEETVRQPGEEFDISGDVPDYLTDLQAIHEAIMTRIVFGPSLHQYQSNEAMFEHQLNEISEREQVPVWHFDASLYCEALLKTLKTWKD